MHFFLSYSGDIFISEYLDPILYKIASHRYVMIYLTTMLTVASFFINTVQCCNENKFLHVSTILIQVPCFLTAVENVFDSFLCIYFR